MLRLPDGQATATLDDNPATRQLVGMLPLRLTMRGAMGQAKIAELPGLIDVSRADRVTDPNTGTVYYWPPTGAIGIHYDDLGQTVPPPGMVRLGTVASGLDAIASAGNRFAVRMDQG